ncbi:MAG: hypothetical protein IKD28_00455 [Clostridia bacterium]|nr:hypothetical protein [Clostridia bacterium]
MAKRKKGTSFQLPTYRLMIFSLLFLIAIEGFVVLNAYRNLTNDTILWFYLLYIFPISFACGALFTLCACLLTKKDYDARQSVVFFLIARGILAMILTIAAIFSNTSWSQAEEGNELGSMFVILCIIAAISLTVQFFLYSHISTRFCAPPKPKPTRAKGELETAPVPSDSVRETAFYQQKYQEYYDMYMGNPPRQPQTPDYSDLDDHDFSQAFGDKNF